MHVGFSTQHHHPMDKLAEMNAVFSGIALYPQLVATVTSHQVAGLSIFAFLIIALTSVIWVVYAVHRKLMPLLLSSTLNLIAALGILLFIFILRS